MSRATNSRRGAQPEVWFRIRHVAEDGHHRPLGDAYLDQTVEVTLGPRGAFKKGNVGTLTRRVAADRIVRALPEPRGKPKSPKKPKTARVVELLQMAIEWQRQLDAGDVETQAAIARREGITRARVTQIMALLRLAPEIQEHILTMPDAVGRAVISERALRAIVALKNPSAQKAGFRVVIQYSE